MDSRYPAVVEEELVALVIGCVWMFVWCIFDEKCCKNCRS
jgi:hypothetical protein